MTREEIALQLTLKKLDDLQFTSTPHENNSEFNKKLGEEIANIYNNVYKNLTCLDINPLNSIDSNDIQVF